VWLLAATRILAGTLALAQAPAPQSVSRPTRVSSTQPNQAQTPTSQAPTATGQIPAAAPRPNRFVVVLDAAHGGDDSGAQLDNAVAEKTVTLALSVQLRSLLAARGFAVVTTRESNVDVAPDARAQVANHVPAVACVSLHASMTGSGVHIFVSSLPATVPTRFLAWKTAQSAYLTRSLKLASTVNSALEHSSDSGSGAVPVLLARTSLAGVDSMACPAVAVELAPIRDTDRTITTQVTDSGYQAQVAQALAAALLAWRTELQAESLGGAGTVRQP
jgi:N-acetylmuramoyl-L-alanine amidase